MRNFLVVVALLILCGLGWFLLNDDTEAPTVNQSENAIAEAQAEAQPRKADDSESHALPQQEETESAEELTAQPPIERVEAIAQIRLLDSNGKAVAGKSILIATNESFQNYLAGQSRLGIAIYFDSILQEAESSAEDGTIAILAEGNKADIHLVVADGFEPFVEPWSPLTSGQTKDVILNPVVPIHVTVVSDQGQPIEGAEVWLRWDGSHTWSESASLFERFESRAYQEATLTDKDGKATLAVCFPDKANSLFVRPPGDFATTTTRAASGQTLTIECATAFTVQGTIWIDGKVPDREVRLAAVIPVGSGSQVLETARSKEEGRYVIKGIPTWSEPILIQAFGDGLALQAKSIRHPMPGEVRHLDFHLVEGIGGHLIFQDPWGEPITNAVMRLRTNAVEGYLNTFELDEAGGVGLPKNFAPGAQYWIDLEIGSQLLSLPNYFHAGTEKTVTVSNLARIEEVLIPETFLGEATVSNVYWKSLSAEGSGHTVWELNDEQPPLLISGFGFLGVILSDGRRLVQPSVLQAGTVAAFSFDLQPSSIRLELPAEPTAQLSLTNKEGLTIASLKEVSGSLEIPCWVGNFTLDVSWPQGFATFPGLDVPVGGIDLGAIQPRGGGVVRGTIIETDEIPMPWVTVRLTSGDSHTSWSCETDGDGGFVFTDVPPGLYYLLVDPSYFYPGFRSARIETLALSEVEPVVERVIVLSPSESFVECTSATTEQGVFFVLATPSGIVSREASSLGPTLLPAQNTDGWLASVFIAANEAWATGLRAPAGPGLYELPAPSSSRKSVRFLDENGNAQTGLLMRLELNGYPMTKRLATDTDGRLNLQIDAAQPWAINVRNGVGHEWVLAVGDLQDGQDIAIPNQVETKLIAIQSTDGKPIPWAVVQPEFLRSVYRANREGQVAVPTSNGWHFASADGYVGQWISESLPSPVTLPAAVTGTSVQAPTKIVRLQWQSLSRANSVWPDYIERLTGSTSPFVLPPLAIGSIKITAFSADGTLAAERKFVLREDDQVLRWE